MTGSWAVLLQDPEPAAPPLPGGVAAVLRFFFNLPQWVQIGGAVAGAVAGIVVAVWVWRHRVALWTWVTTRSRPLKLALGAAVAVGVLAGAVGSAVSWNYMQHDNGFCTGCHVMGPSFARFTQSEHSQLTCHDCHQQSIFASARQLYLWVAERPAEIGAHAPVPNAICEQCHAGGNREAWQRIATTAGHRTHLESDSSALRGVQCVTCHGVEVHRFAPADSTCGSCHSGSSIQLAGMRNQTALHCTACHQFTADVPLLATRDSASGTLTPGSRQCFACHEMRGLLASFDLAQDPHSGSCGMCHNPHTQQRPADAGKTCTTCHSDWRTEPFHRGASHRARGTECLTCHQPHQAKVDAADCEGCHRSARARRTATPPMPFDTLRVVPRPPASGPASYQHGTPPPEPRGKGDSRPFETERVRADTFSHDRHKALPCLTCHPSTDQRSRLTFEPPRGCQLCHHQAEQKPCATCHTAAEVREGAASVTIAVANHPARTRTVPFAHATHDRVACASCHTTPVTKAAAAAVKTCTSCHESHHEADRSCASCHTQADIKAAHRSQPEQHEACDACHAPATVARLTPTRSFCVTCHVEQTRHEAPRQCTVCHFLASPDAYRAHLRKAER